MLTGSRNRRWGSGMGRRCCDGMCGVSRRNKGIITRDITWAGGGTRIGSGDGSGSGIRVRGRGGQKTRGRMCMTSPPINAIRRGDGMGRVYTTRR